LVTHVDKHANVDALKSTVGVNSDATKSKSVYIPLSELTIGKLALPRYYQHHMNGEKSTVLNGNINSNNSSSNSNNINANPALASVNSSSINNNSSTLANNNNNNSSGNLVSVNGSKPKTSLKEDLNNNNTTIDSEITISSSFDINNDIELRFLRPSDIDELKQLCAEWFPVK
jgi:hypothetical protein